MIPPGQILRINPTRQPSFAATDVSYADLSGATHGAQAAHVGAGIDAGISTRRRRIKRRQSISSN
jgi:hypothetical protein